LSKTKVALIIKSAIVIAVLIVLALVPLWGSLGTRSILILVFLYMAMGQMWNLLAGYAGLISLGQQMFIGLGGYSVAVVCQAYGLSITAGLLTVPVVCLLAALIISVPIFKMSGVFFTIGSWIVAEAVLLFFTNWGFVRYGFGFTMGAGRTLSLDARYFIAFVLGVGSVLVVYLILRTRFGLGIMAMRDNEDVAEIRGVKIYRTKLSCFLISAVITGWAGGLMHLFDGFIQPYAAFSINWTVYMVFMVIIGGIGTIEGPIIGAFIYVLLRQYLLNYPGLSMLIFGTIALIIILVAPKGIMGTLHDRTGFELFSVRRKPRGMTPQPEQRGAA
jgi:branched-chain amino acid transport system permease protein